MISTWVTSTDTRLPALRVGLCSNIGLGIGLSQGAFSTILKTLVRHIINISVLYDILKILLYCNHLLNDTQNCCVLWISFVARFPFPNTRWREPASLPSNLWFQSTLAPQPQDPKCARFSRTPKTALQWSMATPGALVGVSEHQSAEVDVQLTNTTTTTFT